MPARLAIVGAGKVGTALAKLLTDAGYDFIGAAGRNLESAQAACSLAGGGTATGDPSDVVGQADLVFITTPDDVIGTVCDRLADELQEGATVAHCSGALPSTALGRARDAGAHIGSMHPLQTFATVEDAIELLPGSCCCIEGDPEAVKVLDAAARAVGARPLAIPTESKALYHAAAVVACNYLVALQNAALRLGEAAGLPRAEFAEALLPLIKGTVHNLEAVGIPGCLTGPVERGDVETVRRHLAALEAAAPDLLPLYRALGRETVDMAVAKGTIDAATADRLRRLV